jgi:hypothetical protein
VKAKSQVIWIGTTVASTQIPFARAFIDNAEGLGIRRAFASRAVRFMPTVNVYTDTTVVDVHRAEIKNHVALNPVAGTLQHMPKKVA